MLWPQCSSFGAVVQLQPALQVAHRDVTRFQIELQTLLKVWALWCCMHCVSAVGRSAVQGLTDRSSHLI
jgi:hypothetical protein